ncbi:protein UPSTREAM OF FLC [Sesamum alatum]|uniref:Protein UPSTREAM OF FLC n=1 Tax=Sesamum alatum TaxID=300844 RepID=A0AAE2CQC2_9LAMI|nr:protein UPSTREAM OF FLC [Sesamum alatum]
MESNIEEGGGRRKMSPDRDRGTKMCMMRPTFKKVQVVYYLSRNGHLDHPHYMELTHLAHQQLRLKDVMERLAVLRGKGMPSLYSWSCKRSYKNGYVWNDLSENDVIFPSEGGAEYVLKGSELVLGCTEKLVHLQFGNVHNQQQAAQDPNFHPKRKSLASKRRTQHQETFNNQCHPAEEEEEQEHEHKAIYASSCSKGVSTEEIFGQNITQKNNVVNTTELTLETHSFSSHKSTTSTSTTTLSDADDNRTSKRLGDGGDDPIGNEPLLSRNSMLFSLIACGGSGSFRKTLPPPDVEEPAPPVSTVGRKSCSEGSLLKGVVRKAAAAGRVAVEEDDMMIRYMSENPRFGNLQSEEKEFFSGSIVEAMATEERVGADQPGPGLKKSASYNQERSSKCKGGLGEVANEQVKKEKGEGVKGKCIPRKKPSSKHSKK